MFINRSNLKTLAPEDQHIETCDYRYEFYCFAPGELSECWWCEIGDIDWYISVSEALADEVGSVIDCAQFS